MTTAPSELSMIGLDANRFRRASQDEWHGPCLFCGGKDRFVLFTDRPFPSWGFFCRQCHPDYGWISEIKPELNKPLSPEEVAKVAHEAEERLKREIKRAQNALEKLQRARSWIKYHEQLTSESRARWERWGIPEFWQLYWKLGFDPDHAVWSNLEVFHTATMTIPIFEVSSWNCLNVRHRLLNPPKPEDKYRPEHAGLPAAAFVADPDCPMEAARSVIVVEGEKKAAVTYITADNPTMQAVGIPGKYAFKLLFDLLKNAEPIYICLDPDATRQAIDLAGKLGKDRCRVIELPGKIDDLIMRYDLDKWWFRNVVKQAVRV